MVTLLFSLIFTPFVGFFGLFLIKKESVQKIFLTGVQLLVFLFSLPLFTFPLGNRFAVLFRWVWFESYQFSFTLGVDSFGVVFICLTSGLFLLNTLFFLKKQFFSVSFAQAFLFLQTALLLLFTAGNLIQFYVSWELVMLPLLYFFLFQNEGSNPKAQKAGLYFFFYNFAASLAMFAGILILYLFAIQNHRSIEFGDLPSIPPSVLSSALWVLFGFTFAVKTPLFFFHAWQPQAYAKAPVFFVGIFAALVSKMGVLLLIRVAFPTLSPPPELINYCFLVLATIGIIYGGWLALSHKNPYKILAYSSLSHLNLLLFGLFNGSALAFQGALFLSIQHALISFGLFWMLALSGNFKHHTPFIAQGKRSLFFSQPYFAGLILVFALANAGFPGFSGFVGEFSILLGGFSIHPLLTGFASLVVILSASYSFVWLKSFLYETEFESTIAVMDRILLSFLAILLVVFGIYPVFLFSFFQV